MAPSTLAAVSGRISAPLPAKTRFLRELAADLHELTARLQAEGVPEDEARRRAVEHLVPDAETARRLERLYASWYVRATSRWSAGRLRRIERLLLALCFLGVLVVETRALSAADLLAYRSPFLWPVLGAGALTVTAVLVKAFQLWVKADHVDLRRGLRLLPVLSVLPCAIALLGISVDGVTVAATLERAPELAGTLLLRSLIQDTALLAVSLLFFLFGALGWLVASQWVAVQEDAYRNALSLEGVASPEGTRSPASTP